MIHFVICEDNPSTGSIIKGFISEYTPLKSLDCRIYLFQNQFDKVIEFAQANVGHTNVFFLDIILNQESLSGFTLARQIRKKDIMAYIIFISSHPEFSLKILQYKLRALDYIYKHDENFQKRIFECIDIVLDETTRMEDEDSAQLITLKGANSIHSVRLNDIMYIETRPGSRLLHCTLKDGAVLAFHDTLKNVIKSLDGHFYRCHRSYIVNIRQIRKLENKKQYYSVTMNDGKVCDISKPNWKELISRVKV